MTRFMSREEWPLIAGGVTAGVLTSAVVLYFFVTGIGGANGTHDLLSDTTVVVTPQPLEAPARAVNGDASGPLIGARESGIRGRLSRMVVRTTPLRGPIAVTAREVVLNEDGGARFARAAAISGQLQLTALRNGDVVLEGVVVRNPVVALREGPGGWNYEQVFAELLDGGDGGGESGRRRTIQLRDVRIEDGTVDVARPDQRFAFRSIDGQLPMVVFSQEGVAAPYLRVAQLNAQFVQAEPEAQLAVEIGPGLFAFPEGTVRFDVETAALDRTRFADLRGAWNPADPGYGVTATGVALGVEFEDIRFALPEAFPESGTATFAWAVRPVGPNHTEVTLTDLEAETEGSRLLGSVTMRLGGERFELLAADLRVDPLALALVERFSGPIPYDGTLTGTIRGTDGDIRFDLEALLSTAVLDDPFRTGIVGRVRYTDAGLALQQLDLDLRRVPLAALRAFAPGLPLSGSVTGVVSLAGAPGRSPLDVNVRLELGAGIALVEGRLDLTGAIPSYDLTGRLISVDLQAIMEPRVPPVALSAGFTFVGSGFDPATMTASIGLNGRFNGWETTPGDTISVAADIRGGALVVERLRGSLATAELEASGTWRFTAPQQGAVTYAVNVTSLRPFGPYIPVIGDSISSGNVQASGTMSGTLQRLRLAGRAVGGDLRVGGWRAQSITADYDLTTGGGSLPVAVITAEGSNVFTPTAGNYDTGTLSLRLTPPGLDFDVNAVRTDGGVVEIAASGVLPETGEREITLERARFDLSEDRWMLQQPATFRWTAGGPVYVADLEVSAERGGGSIRVDGRVLPLADVDAELGIAAVPVGDIQRLLGQPVRVDGMLWVEGTIRGGVDDSFVDLTFRLQDGALQGMPVRRLDGTLVHANGETQLDAEVVADTAGRLDVTARLPSRLRLGGDTIFTLVDGVPLSGSLTAENFALGPLLATVPQVRDATGLVNANVTLAGTADAPQVAGVMTLAAASFRVPQLNQTFTEASGEVGFDGRRLVVNDLRVRSEGWLVIGGEVVLERLTSPVLDLTVALDDFEPVGVDNLTDAAVWGDLSLTGPPDALLLTGGISVGDGYVVIPELGGPSFRPELVDLTRPAAWDTVDLGPVPAATDIISNLTIRDLTVDVNPDTWFVAYDARAQLEGRLVVNKTGDSYPIVGTLSGNRGQYTLVAGPIVRRFEIASAQVRFLGTPRPNPAIDITARRIVLDQSGRPFDVDVRITGTAQDPTLQLAGGTPGQIAESELLSYLIFGQPTFEADQQITSDQLLTQTYAGAFWEMVSLELERSLGGVGLDIFQVRFGQGALGGIGSPTIIVGKQFRDDVFLTLETALAGLFGENAVSTWSIRLDWALDRRSRLRLALEPVYRGRALRSSAFALPLDPPRQQLLIELRRRWTY